jgi:hypothetical protein
MLAKLTAALLALALTVTGEAAQRPELRPTRRPVAACQELSR